MKINFYPDESGGTNIEAKIYWTAFSVPIVLLLCLNFMVRRLVYAYLDDFFLLVIPLFTVLLIVVSHLTEDMIPNKIKDRIHQRILSIENGEKID